MTQKPKKARPTQQILIYHQRNHMGARNARRRAETTVKARSGSQKYFSMVPAHPFSTLGTAVAVGLPRNEAESDWESPLSSVPGIGLLASHADELPVNHIKASQNPLLCENALCGRLLAAVAVDCSAMLATKIKGCPGGGTPMASGALPGFVSGRPRNPN